MRLRLVKVLLVIFELLLLLSHAVILLLLTQVSVSFQDAAVGLDVPDVLLGRLGVHVHVVGVYGVGQAGHGVHVDGGSVVVEAGVQLALLLGGLLLAVHGSQVGVTLELWLVGEGCLVIERVWQWFDGLDD